MVTALHGYTVWGRLPFNRLPCDASTQEEEERNNKECNVASSRSNAMYHVENERSRVGIRFSALGVKILHYGTMILLRLRIVSL